MFADVVAGTIFVRMMKSKFSQRRQQLNKLAERLARYKRTKPGVVSVKLPRRSMTEVKRFCRSTHKKTK